MKPKQAEIADLSRCTRRRTRLLARRSWTERHTYGARHSAAARRWPLETELAVVPSPPSLAVDKLCSQALLLALLREAGYARVPAPAMTEGGKVARSDFAWHRSSSAAHQHEGRDIPSPPVRSAARLLTGRSGRASARTSRSCVTSASHRTISRFRPPSTCANA